jgi:hypothetical protein
MRAGDAVLPESPGRGTVDFSPGQNPAGLTLGLVVAELGAPARLETAAPHPSWRGGLSCRYRRTGTQPASEFERTITVWSVAG